MNKKIKMMDQRPQISDDELKGYMDFNSVLNRHNEVVSGIEKKSLVNKIVAGSIGVIAVVSIVWFASSLNGSGSADTGPVKQPAIDSISRSQLPSTKPIVEQDNKEKPSRTETSPKRRKAIDEPDRRDSARGESKATVTQKNPSTEQKTESGYVPAEPLKGYPELYTYFNTNLVYPKEAMKDSVQGVLTVSFIINKNGKAEKIEVTNSLGALLDQEAIRLIGSMPEWKPAVLNGKRIPSRISLPITFQIVKTKVQ